MANQAPSLGLLFVRSDADMRADEDAARKAAELASKAGADKMDPLADYVLAQWDQAKRTRETDGIDEEMLKSLRAVTNTYDPDTLATINAQGLSTIFLGMTGMKCRTGAAWLREFFLSDVDRPFKIKPSPVPEMPPSVIMRIVEETMSALREHVENGGGPVGFEDIAGMAEDMRKQVEDIIQQTAEERSDRMEKTVADQLLAGGWYPAFDQFITNLLTFPLGWLKGPIVRMRQKLVWTADGPQVDYRPVLEWSAPHPMNMYVSSDSETVSHGFLFERQRIAPGELYQMVGTPGWVDKALYACLDDYGSTGYREADPTESERVDLEKRQQARDYTPNSIEVQEMHGPVIGSLLREHGIERLPDGTGVNERQSYDVNAIVAGTHLLYRSLSPYPVPMRPYNATSWDVVPGAIHGRGVPQLMADVQKVCNATVRSIVTNGAVCAGPQWVFTDIDRLVAGESAEDIFPNRVWQFRKSVVGDSSRPMDYFQPNFIAGELIKVFDYFAYLADLVTGIPAYAAGDDQMRAAGRTMGGMAMLQSNASRGIKQVIMRIDNDVVKPAIGRLYWWNMLFSEDEDIKGDCEVVTGGAVAQLVKTEMAARRLNFLTAVTNPVDTQIIGPEQRANLLRAIASTTELPPDDIVPTREEMKRRMATTAAAAQVQAQAGMAGMTAGGAGAPPQQPGAGGR